MLYYASDKGLLSQEELQKKKKVKPFQRTSKKGERFWQGPIPQPHTTGNQYGEFTSVGLYKPLKITIQNVYTGIHPIPFAGKGKKSPILITTGIKKEKETKPSAWAVNYLRDNVGDHQFLETPGATETGTPIVYYSPSVTEKKIFIDFCMMFDNFKEETFKSVADGMTTVANLPFVVAFPIYGPVLKGAAKILEIITDIIERKIDNPHDFISRNDLNIAEVGQRDACGFYVVLEKNRKDLDQNTFPSNYELNDDCCLVEKVTKNPYSGDCPYIVIGIDGAEDKDLIGFESYVATAEILNKYFGIQQTKKESIDKIIEGATYCTDIYYRNKLDNIDNTIKNLKTTASGEKKTQLENERNAYANNIVNDIMKKNQDSS